MFFTPNLSIFVGILQRNADVFKYWLIFELYFWSENSIGFQHETSHTCIHAIRLNQVRLGTHYSRVQRRLNRPKKFSVVHRWIVEDTCESSGLHSFGLFSSPWFSGWVVGRAWCGCDSSGRSWFQPSLKPKSIQTGPFQRLELHPTLTGQARNADF